MENQDLIDQVAADGQAEDSNKSSLGRSDWLAAGLRVLIEDGIDAVRITRLAEDLKVTRGSFYWHFKDREDLLDGLIEVWARKNTAGVIASVTGAETLAAGILSMFDTWLDLARFDPRLDQAMRDWARRSEVVHKAVVEADEARVDAITSLYRRFGHDELEAHIRARVIYFGQVGYYTLGIEEPMTQRLSYLELYYRCFTGAELDPKIADLHRARHLSRETDRKRETQ